MVFDGVEVLPFINRKESNAGTLSVTKVVENVKGTAAFAQDEFGFLLYRKKHCQSSHHVAALHLQA